MSDTMLLVVGLGSIFLAVAIAVMLLVGRSTAPAGVARSLAAIDALSPDHAVAHPSEQSFGTRVVIPFASDMKSLAARLSPGGVSQTLQRRLDVAGNPSGLTPDSLLAYKGLGLVVGLALGGLLGARHGFLWLLGGAAIAGAVLFFLPDLLVYNTGLKRQDKIRKTLPDALDMLTISVEAGLGFDAALGHVAQNTTGPLSGEFFRVLKEMQIGKGRSEAFQDLAERTTVDELHSFVSALVQADRQGIPIAAVLREQAKEMRLRRRQAAEEAAAKVPVKILFPLVVCILPAMFVVIIGPGAVQIVQAFTGQR
jgi:tight adherence protein C